MFGNNFPRREWTDSEKWVCGIIGGMVIVFLAWAADQLAAHSDAKVTQVEQVWHLERPAERS